MATPTVVFDLDGTLIDTAPDLVGTLNVIFAREGLAAFPLDVARTMVGGGARAMIEHGLNARGHSVTPAKLTQMFDDFIAHYADHIADRSRPFPGLDTTLDALASRARLAVCTNKREGLSRLLLDKLGLTKRFAVICGQDTFGMQKPDPEVLRRTIAGAGGDIAHAIMIGDSITDIRTARAAGVPVVAVDFGYSDRPIAEYAPDRVISRMQALPAAVAELLDNR
ncbi:MAG TPA: HAD-IA family hydrolase [Pseudolabrys sp.]|nr:HAD-IA family hydrolase [Pseudolabrys sp.]